MSDIKQKFNVILSRNNKKYKKEILVLKHLLHKKTDAKTFKKTMRKRLKRRSK